MAAQQTAGFGYETLLGMIPFVMDFLDLDSEEVLASGILDDDERDEAVIALILSHRNTKTIDSSNKRSQISGIPSTGHCSNACSSKSDTYQEFTVSRNKLDDFVLQYRMTKTMFENLLHDAMKLTSFSAKKLVEGTEVEVQGPSTLPMDPAPMLLLTLRFLGSQQSMDELACYVTGLDTSVSAIVHETINALYDLMQHYLCWPDSGKVLTSSESFRQTCGLHGVLGVIDVLHVRVEAPDDHTDYYTNQQGETTVLLQTVTDHQLRFLHCCTGWPGSVSEVSVLKDSDLFSDVQTQVTTYFPDDSYVIGDEAYPLTEWLMTPYNDDDSLSVVHHRFNAACRTALQNSASVYTLLMKRFPRLDFLDLEDMQSMLVTILVCCALHNFCLDQGGSVEFEDANVVVRNINSCPEPVGCFDSDSMKGETKRQSLLDCLL
ncbi:putative nuclease HARBI1 [Littorina saxatilis]|uniref:putative nuclease HARBI1 n=1 Tax=Littorina saxatilis TaxID=31220 RepID=UPI0038B59FF4